MFLCHCLCNVRNILLNILFSWEPESLPVMFTLKFIWCKIWLVDQFEPLSLFLSLVWVCDRNWFSVALILSLVMSFCVRRLLINDTKSSSSTSPWYYFYRCGEIQIFVALLPFLSSKYCNGTTNILEQYRFDFHTKVFGCPFSLDFLIKKFWKQRNRVYIQFCHLK